MYIIINYLLNYYIRFNIRGREVAGFKILSDN